MAPVPRLANKREIWKPAPLGPPEATSCRIGDRKSTAVRFRVSWLRNWRQRPPSL